MNKKILIAILFVAMIASAIVLRIKNGPVEDINNLNESIIININSNGIVNDNSDIVNEEVGCSDDPVIFTESFTDKNKIKSVGPIGALDGGSHGRSYVELLSDGLVEVYAPIDATLEHLVYHTL